MVFLIFGNGFVLQICDVLVDAYVDYLDDLRLYIVV